MKTTVVFHSADYDGIFCREIAKKFLPDAEPIGWNFGDQKIAFPEGNVYVLDLSPDCLEMPPDSAKGYWERLIWIDHHKTSIEKWCKDIPGYRIDGVAACRLAWQWFGTFNDSRNPIGLPSGIQASLPTKQDFIDRKVTEPLAVRLAGEYDIWDKRDPDAETLQYALRIHTLSDDHWKVFLSYNGVPMIERFLQDGRVAQSYSKQVDASICKSRTWLMDWEGLKFLCVNSARFNSLFFAAKDVPETGHDALMGFCFDGKCWTVSLYHAKHRTDLDLSEIAKKYGGGGHRGACGFTCKELPFPLNA